MPSPNRHGVLAFMRKIARTELGPHLVLAGSSSLHAISSVVPPLTEDVGVLIETQWLAEHEQETLETLEALGYRHVAGTCTFVAESGESVDLVGYSKTDRRDRTGGGTRVPVMVFGDLSVILAQPGSVVTIPQGGRALSPAAFAASKLLTVRLDKGAKDKIQALLIIAEHGEDDAFGAQLRSLLAKWPEERIADAIADAQAAVLAVAADPCIADPQSKGYASMVESAERGLARLIELLRPCAGRDEQSRPDQRADAR